MGLQPPGRPLQRQFDSGRTPSHHRFILVAAGRGAMTQDHAHDDPIVVYRASAILLAALVLSLLFMPFEWILGGAKSPEFIAAIAGRIGEGGARLLVAAPCALLAAFAARGGWGGDD